MNVTAWPLRRLIWSALLTMMIGLIAGCTSGPSAEESASTPEPSQGSVDSATDETVAVVGDSAISRSQLTDRLLQGYGVETLREMMLREAANLEAASLGIRVADEEIDGEIRNMSEGYGSESQFYAEMKNQLGMDRAAVREDARFRLLLEKLATRGVNVPDEDIAAYYEEHRDEYGSRTEYRLAWILTDTRENAEEVLGRLESGKDFGELAGEFSMDESTADADGDLGWIEENDPFHDAKVLSAAGQLRIGEAAGPLRMESGYAVVQLNGKKTIEGRELSAVREEIRRILAMERAVPMKQLEKSLLAKYGAKVLDPKLDAQNPR